jgi:adenine deaminase
VLAASSVLPASNRAGDAASRQQSPQFDLLIKNGHVIDPGNGIDSVMDVAVTGAKIARVAANIDPASARRVADATGLHVVPGLPRSRFCEVTGYWCR